LEALGVAELRRVGAAARSVLSCEMASDPMVGGKWFSKM
jgi:hypothetical protein